MTREEILATVDALREAGCLFLGVTGGEPLVHPHGIDVIEHAGRRGLAVQLLTNGTLLTSEVVERLAACPHLLGVSVSLYGAEPATHDAVTRFAGSFKRTWDGVSRLRQRGLSVVLKFILMRGNRHEARAMIESAEARGIPFVADVCMTGRHDGTPVTGAERLLPAEVETLLRGPLRAWNPDGPGDVTEANFPCNCARGNCAVSARGDVFPCITVPWPAGNLRERPFAEIWRDAPVFRRIRGLRIADYPHCAPCALKPWCSRDRGAAYLASGSYTGIDPWICAVAEARRRVATGSTAREAAADPSRPEASLRGRKSV
jgi:radical SAM protein with 4Fe4S-binding SPASM domain